jgi:curved DNA-binding protein
VGPKPFVDHYEALQLSPNATEETLERVYRLLAKRYHPDNQSTGDAEKFSSVLLAYRVLSDPAARASYDAKYDEHRSVQWKIFDQRSAGDAREEDRRIHHGILSLLYVARRRDPKSGGLGAVFLEKMLGCPQQHLEFPLWYLKQHGWIEITESGQLAITVTGVDKLEGADLALPSNRLLAQSSLERSEDDLDADSQREPRRIESETSVRSTSGVA